MGMDFAGVLETSRPKTIRLQLCFRIAEPGHRTPAATAARPRRFGFDQTETNLG